MATSKVQRILNSGAAAAQANGLVTAELNVEVNAGAVSLLWSIKPQPGGTIVTLTAILGALQNGVLKTQFCGAEYPVAGNGRAPMSGTLSGTAACFVPPPTQETAAILAGEVDGPGGGMFFFTQPFSL